MNEPRKSLIILGIFSVCFAASAFSQTVTIPFDTAQQYTNNFNETYDPNNAVNWNSGAVAINSSFATSSTGNALYNPNATTTTAGPTYQTATVQFDFSTNTFATSAGTFGILARAQLDGHAVCAYVRPANTGVQVTVAYGLFNQSLPTLDGTLYSANFTDFSFAPTHITLQQYQTNGVPTFNFILTNSAGTTRDTGPLSLTGTTAYNAAGEVGFYMNVNQIGSGSLDNFSISPTVPEPSTYLFCGLGLFSGWLAVRKKKKFVH